MPITSDGRIVDLSNARLDSDRRALVRFGEIDRRSFSERRQERMNENELEINKAIAAELSRRAGVQAYEITYSPERWGACLACSESGITLQENNLFTQSLDSCRLFEETLTPDEWRKYLVERAISVDICGADFIMFDLDEIMKIDRQSPAQRCEAFLRVIGKWEGE